MLSVGYKDFQDFVDDIEGFDYDLETIVKEMEVVVSIHKEVLKMATTRKMTAINVLDELKTKNKNLEIKIENMKNEARNMR